MLNTYDRCPAWTFFDPITRTCVPVMSRATFQRPIELPDNLRDRLPDSVTPEEPTLRNPDDAIVDEAGKRKEGQSFKKKLALEKASRETISSLKNQIS